jgi:hypothetical protein
VYRPIFAVDGVMWDALGGIIDALDVVARPRFYVGLATGGAAIGWGLMELAEAGMFVFVLFALAGGAAGAVWQWRANRDE